MTRGNIYMAQLPQTGEKSVQFGYRPVLVVQNDKGNAHSSVVQVIPITSKIKKNLPVHVIVSGFGLEKTSTVLTEQITTISKNALYKYIGSFDEETMAKVNNCIAIQLGLLSM